MKTKVVDKKERKRSLSETSVSIKSNQKQRNINELKKSSKKAKLDGFKQNGNPISREKASVSKVNKQKKEQNKIEQQNSIIKPSKREIKRDTKEKTELTAVKSKKDTGRRTSKMRRRRPYSSLNLTEEQIKKKIAEIKSRQVLSKRAKRILGVLNRKLREYENESQKLDTVEKKNKKAEHSANVLMKNKQKASDEDKTKTEKKHVQSKGKPQEEEEEEDDDDDDSNVEEDIDDSNDEEESEEDESETENLYRGSLAVNKKKQFFNKGYEDEEDEDDEDEEDEDDEDDDDDDDDDEVKNKEDKDKKLIKMEVENEKDEVENEDDEDDDEDDEDDDDEDDEGEDKKMKVDSEEDEEDEDEEDEDEDDDDDDDEDEDEEDEGNVIKQVILPEIRKTERQNKNKQEQKNKEQNKNKQEQNKNKQEQNKNKPEQNKNKQSMQSLDDQQKEIKKRYVLFVGNLPLNITEDEIKQHFLTKVDTVASIRIPIKPDKTPRGFAYVEVTNNVDFEKGLSLNHTFLKKRRINVEYSLPTGGKKTDATKKLIVAKNMKLQALQKAGKLADQNRKKKPFKKQK